MQHRIALLLLSLSPWALAIPVWSGLPGAASIGSLVPGTTVIEAILNRRDPMVVGDHRQKVTIQNTYHLSTTAVGEAQRSANALKYQSDRFYLRCHWQFNVNSRD